MNQTSLSNLSSVPEYVAIRALAHHPAKKILLAFFDCCGAGDRHDAGQFVANLPIGVEFDRCVSAIAKRLVFGLAAAAKGNSIARLVLKAVRRDQAHPAA
jgi:hypothetical protein